MFQKKLPRYKTKTYKHEIQYNLDDYLTLIELGDITDTIVTINNERYKSGKSADWTAKDGFFDTEYYIDDISYKSYEEYRQQLLRLVSVDGVIKHAIFVHQVDGGKPYTISHL